MNKDIQKIDFNESKQLQGELKTAIDEFEENFYKESVLDKIKRRIRRFNYRVSTVWKFAKLGWDDYDWDQYYLLKLLEMKLEMMYNFFMSDSVICEEGEKKAKEIKIALDACHRLVENEYEFIAMIPHDEKWGKSKTSFEETDPVTKCTRVVFSRENVKTSEDEKQEREDFLKCYENAQKEYQKDADLLFDTMKKYHQGWWD